MLKTIIFKSKLQSQTLVLRTIANFYLCEIIEYEKDWTFF